MNSKIVAETERLLLRELHENDANSFFQLNNNPEVLKYTGDDPFNSTEEAKSFIKNYDQYKINGFGRWAIIEKKSNKFIGFCGLKLNEEGMVDLGFRIFEEEWGKGYATEAAIASMQVGFNYYNLEEIVGRADKQNLASLKVLKKIGMQFWKTDTTEHISDAVYYKITKGMFYEKHNS